MKTLRNIFPAQLALAASHARSVLVAAWLSISFLGIVQLLPSNAAAQSATTGAVSGTVTDPSGAIVPLASVELVSNDTNAAQVQTANASGQYLFSGVRPGQYKITVKTAGFRTSTVANVTVAVNKALDLDFKLEVGADNQTVEVTAAAGALLQTTDSQIGNSISKDLISRLPTLQRNVTELMNLQPGVVPTGSNLGARITGAIDDQNTVTLDGIDVTAVSVASTTSVPTRRTRWKSSASMSPIQMPISLAPRAAR